MTVTTSYGSWNNHAGGANTNLEGDIADIIESVDLGAIVETHDPDNEDAEHGYMAAIGTAHDVVAGDYSDVTVTEAAADLNVDEDGNETVTPVFGTTVVYGPVETDVRTDDEEQLFKVEAAAEALLEQAGWEVTGPWQITDNALYATVERA